VHLFVSHAGILDRVDDPQERAASDSESDWSMDSIKASVILLIKILIWMILTALAVQTIQTFQSWLQS
jgi:hypothetical protein